MSFYKDPKSLYLALFLCFTFFSVPILLNAQTTINGIVLDQQQNPIIGASILIEGSYDGTISEVDGTFSFESYEEGEVTLVVSYLGYETKQFNGPVNSFKNLQIKLRESVMALDAVEVTASTFKAGDNSKVAVLKPLDIVTTAGSMGDVIAALQTLPGTQSNPEDGRLFVRGGDARETNIYVDGLRVFSPYIRTIGGSPTRGRFSPFLFKGISFSTGGYSAAYGQSLSGILEMNTIDEPNDTETNISLMTVGVGVGHIQKGDKHSISANASYIDLSPYNWVVPTRVSWIQPYHGFSGEAVYRFKTKKGLLKSYVAGDINNFELSQTNINSGLRDTVRIRNANVYSNTTFNTILSKKTSIFGGISLGYNSDQLRIKNNSTIDQSLNGIHARLALKSVLHERFIVHTGLEYLNQRDEFDFLNNEPVVHNELNRTTLGAFLEADYFFSKNLAIKTGIRAEYNELLDKTIVDPRFTLAQKLSTNSQISLAYGQFTQSLDPAFLYFENRLPQERSSHYLLNYNIKTDKQILRIETYYKDYRDLLKHDGARENPSNFNSNGDGYAYGLDVFWRANQFFKNLDFWVSYGWIEHQRDYRNFPTSATPVFTTAHNMSIVSKFWMGKLKSQLGVSLNAISGRPYENPNTPGFLNERSKIFKNISVSWAYLISQQKILFISASNPTRFKNEFGYEYANTRNEMGLFPGRVIRPNDDQFFFVGFFMTISKDKTKNQLDNL